MMMPSKQLFFVVAVIITLGTISSTAISKGKSEDKIEKYNNRPQKQWYLRNTVSVYDAINDVSYAADNAAVLGKLIESNQGYDKHDIIPFVSLINAKAAVLFIHDDWGERSGEYHSDYHGVNRQSDSWVMTVYSSVTGGEVRLKWDGLYALTSAENKGLVTYQEQRMLNSRTLRNLHLIDLKTLEVIAAVSKKGELNSYSFKLDPEETNRNFRWVLGPINASYFDPASGALQYVKDHQPEFVRQRRGVKQGRKFGLPPRY